MTITGKYIDVDNVKTYYEEIGNRKNPAIVCLHTAGRDNRQWHNLMNLMKESYYLVALDMPGHAKSWPLPNLTCIDNAADYTAFIWSFIESMDIKNPIIAGVSLGGNISLQLASTYSEKVRAVIAMEGADYTPTISEQSLAMMTNPYVSLPYNNYDFSESLVGRDCDTNQRQFLNWSTLQLSPLVQKGDLTTYTNFDNRKNAYKITCPVLIIRGKDDWIVTSKMVKETYNRLTNVHHKKLIEIEGLGHFPHVENPNLMYELMSEFLEYKVMKREEV